MKPRRNGRKKIIINLDFSFFVEEDGNGLFLIKKERKAFRKIQFKEISTEFLERIIYGEIEISLSGKVIFRGKDK